MIVRILSAGKSFKGLSTYLTHDPKAQTDERVGWTHTLNLAHDHVPSAVDEMLWTARSAELLKQEAGIRAGGRATENAVKHLSLNWSPEDNPDRAHMIETAEEFLRHMKWHEHQAILVAHEDKAHAHVHIMLNVIHPETGLRLDDNFDRRRAQVWALAYEREQGRIHCEQRLLQPEEREAAPTRDAWMDFRENQREFERAENALRQENRENAGDEYPSHREYSAEWKILKGIEKRERLDFFAEGRAEFSELRQAVYRDVREEFRERWADYYEARRSGLDEDRLASIKAELLAEQKSVLAERRDAACQELRLSRDEIYREILDDQRDIRHGLHARQDAGFDNTHFLQLVEERSQDRHIDASFRDTGEQVTAPRAPERTAEDKGETMPDWHEHSTWRPGVDVGASLATGFGFGVLSFFESLADGFVGARPAPRRHEPEPEDGPTRRDLFDIAARDAAARQQREREIEDEEWRKKQRLLDGD